MLCDLQRMHHLMSEHSRCNSILKLNTFSNNVHSRFINLSVTRTTGSFLDNSKRNLILAGIRPHMTLCAIRDGIISTHFITFQRTLILLRTNTSCQPCVRKSTFGKEPLTFCLSTCSWRINDKMSTNDARIETSLETTTGKIYKCSKQ